MLCAVPFRVTDSIQLQNYSELAYFPSIPFTKTFFLFISQTHPDSVLAVCISSWNPLNPYMILKIGMYLVSFLCCIVLWVLANASCHVSTNTVLYSIVSAELIDSAVQVKYILNWFLHTSCMNYWKRGVEIPNYNNGPVHLSMYLDGFLFLVFWYLAMSCKHIKDCYTFLKN